MRADDGAVYKSVRVAVFAVSVRVVVVAVFVMRVVVRPFDGLRAPGKDDVSMRCGIGMAVNPTAVAVG
jgi:hypothetical protein